MIRFNLIPFNGTITLTLGWPLVMTLELRLVLTSDQVSGFRCRLWSEVSPGWTLAGPPAYCCHGDHIPRRWDAWWPENQASHRELFFHFNPRTENQPEDKSAFYGSSHLLCDLGFLLQGEGHQFVPNAVFLVTVGERRLQRRKENMEVASVAAVIVKTADLEVSRTFSKRKKIKSSILFELL